MKSEKCRTVESFEDYFLENLRFELCQKKRTLKKRNTLIDILGTQIVANDWRGELLEAFLRMGNRRVDPFLKFKAWSDREIWIDAREWTKAGWSWHFTINGRLTFPIQPSEIVTDIEESIGMIKSLRKGSPAKLLDVWRKRIAIGPRQIP